MILYFLYRSVIHFTQSCLVYGFYGVLLWRLMWWLILSICPHLELTRIQPAGCICEGFFSWLIWGGRSTLDLDLLRSENPPRIWVTLSGACRWTRTRKKVAFDLCLLAISLAASSSALLLSYSSVDSRTYCSGTVTEVKDQRRQLASWVKQRTGFFAFLLGDCYCFTSQTTACRLL